MRRTADWRVPLKIFLSPIESVQFLFHSSSLVAAMAARASATFLSNISRTCFCDCATSGLKSAGREAAKSSLSVVRAPTPNPGSSAKWPARRPSSMDLSCGFQVSLSSGMRSRVRRVAAISASNSGSRVSLMDIVFSVIVLAALLFLRLRKRWFFGGILPLWRFGDGLMCAGADYALAHDRERSTITFVVRGVRAACANAARSTLMRCMGAARWERYGGGVVHPTGLLF